jgi:hypothetical protein
VGDDPHASAVSVELVALLQRVELHPETRQADVVVHDAERALLGMWHDY